MSSELAAVSYHFQCLVFPLGCLSLPLNKMPRRLFLLVRWLEDETVGVTLSTAANVDGDDQLTVGAVLPIKFDSKFYQAEILKISREY